jgi:hypothetical protein
LGQYAFKIIYIPGADNSAADALSRLPPKPVNLHPSPSLPFTTASTSLRVSVDPALLSQIRAGYNDDPWCKRLQDSGNASRLRRDNGLWYLVERLIIPRVPQLRESIFCLAHDTLGHFGFDKSYETLRDAYFWPHMRTELESMYIPSCDSCQRNKPRTVKTPGPLHLLPVPPGCGDSMAIDFIGPLPEDEGFNYLMTMTCRLHSDVRLVPCKTSLTAEEAARLFFVHWYCKNGLPLDIVLDRDKLWTSRFWTALHRLTGVDLKLSSAFHPEMDGASERINKTVIQAVRYHVQRNQRGWVRALPLVRFAIMSTVNASTGFAPFQIRHGRRPRVIPPLLDVSVADVATTFPLEALAAAAVIRRIEVDVLEAMDNLSLVKIDQARQANRAWGEEPVFKVGEDVLLSTFHRRRKYMQSGDNRVAKFMVRYDGPYKILQAHPETSSYTLDIPPSMNIFPTFHVSLLKAYRYNSDDIFPGCKLEEPGPVVSADGEQR